MDSETAPPRTTRRGLGEMLVAEKLVTPEQMESALTRQRREGGKLGDILIEQGVSARKLAALLSIQLNLPLIDLKRHTVQPRALRLIPESLARKHALIPLDIVNDALVVVMADPADITAIEDIKAQARMRVEAALGVRADIERAINLNYRSCSAIERQLSRLAPAAGKDGGAAPLAASTPVAETLDLIVAQAVKDRASDVHIEPQEDRLRIRYRIDGILHDMFSFPLAVHDSLVSRVKILAGLDIAEQRRPQDGQFAIRLGPGEVDIRAATMGTPHGERVTLRILDKSLALFTLAELGMVPAVLDKYRALLQSPHGLLLAGGPTGSGKTTTLYASISELDRNERNIMTIEDPIEYSFLDINQTQVNARAGLTFAGGLRAIMRHDPDVILVGEIRDDETVTAAVQAALTGHLVLSSIHANDAAGILSRLADLGVEPPAVSSTLTGAVAQRMVRRICPDCRTTHQPSAAERQALAAGKLKAAPRFYAGAGCNLCAGTGYRGRIGIFELMVMSEEIRKLLRRNAGAGEIQAQAVAEGMVTMKEDGLRKAGEGLTTISEVMRRIFAVN